VPAPYPVYAPPPPPEPYYRPPVHKDEAPMVHTPDEDSQPYPGTDGSYSPLPPIQNRMPVNPPRDADWIYVPGTPSFEGRYHYKNGPYNPPPTTFAPGAPGEFDTYKWR